MEGLVYDCRECIRTNDLKRLQQIVSSENVNAPSDVFGYSILRYAITRCSAEIIEWLLRIGADPSTALRANGWNSYHVHVAITEHKDILQLLLKYNKAGLHDTTKYGSSALDLAIDWNKPGIASILMDHGVKCYTNKSVEWFRTLRHQREKCRDTSYAILQLKKRNAQKLQGNSRDVLRLLAKYVWNTRIDKKWNEKIKRVKL